MERLIKRYGSRKLYDTAASRYVSLEELAAWIRAGEQVRVLDLSGEDVTVQTLTQVISDEGRRGRSLPSNLLHELIRFGEDALRAGEEAVSSHVRQFQEEAGRIVQSSLDRFGPVREVREEMTSLRQRLEELESSLSRLEAGESAPAPESSPEPSGSDTHPQAPSDQL
jgi:polyhydroxyalkanoate synthesis repressor PhaR